MIVLQEDMASFGKREWTVQGAAVPPDWATALERLDKPEGAVTSCTDAMVTPRCRGRPSRIRSPTSDL